MNAVRILVHLARADFFERTRRYSFLVMLGLVLWLGYVVVSGQFRMSVSPNYAGVVNSAWVGTLMALTTSFVLGLVGFYIVKGSVARDYDTGVGQIMATTPMGRHLYVLGKWLSNYAVLGITIAVLALAGIGMNLWLGEGGLDIGALVAPLALIALPWLGLIAALAVLFESVGWLRGGLGNIVYAVLWLVLIGVTLGPTNAGTPGSAANPALDLTGMRTIGDSVSQAARAVYPDAKTFMFGSGFIPGDAELFTYPGIRWTAGFLASRLLVLLVAVGLVALAGFLFDRFDPARLLPVKRRGAAPAPAPAPAAEPAPARGVHLTPLSAAQARSRFPALLSGELKLVFKSQRLWWYAVAAGLVVAQLASPTGWARYLLIVAWVWPALILSGLGCRENRFDTRQIVFSAPRPMSQLPAAWLSGALVTALLGSGVLVRFVLAGDAVVAAAAGWLTAVLFIPSLALALGTLTGSGKAFEVIYVLWMYLLTQGVAALDFAGLVPGSRFYVYVPVAIGLVAVAAIVRRRQIQAR